MEMIETYLDAVAAQLPRDTRDDIVAELRDTLLSRVEEREDALGRALTDDELEDLLRAMGHPLVVAARYRTGPQQLIGPELFPYWLFAVKVGLLILALVYALDFVAGTLGGMFHGGHVFGRSLSGLFGSGLTLIGAVTVAGAVCEHFGLRPAYLDRWRVRDLAVLRLGDPASWADQVAGAIPSKAGRFSRPFTGMGGRTRARAGGRAGPWAGRVDRTWPGAGALGSLIWGLVFVAWWVGALGLPGLTTFGLHRQDVAVTPAAIWAALYAPILAYAIAQIAVDAIGVVRPAAVRLRATLQIPVAVAGAALAWTALSAGTWFTLARDGETETVRGGIGLLDPDRLAALGDGTHTLAELAAALGVVLSWVLAGIMLVLALKVLASGWRIVTGR